MSTPSRAAPPCAATWSTCPPASPRPPVSRCCTCPRTGHGRSGGKPCGTTSSATARRSHEQDDPYIPCPPAIPGPTPETRGKLLQASRSLMPTPFRTAPIVQNQPRDGTKSLIRGFRLSSCRGSAQRHPGRQACLVKGDPCCQCELASLSKTWGCIEVR